MCVYSVSLCRCVLCAGLLGASLLLQLPSPRSLSPPSPWPKSVPSATSPSTPSLVNPCPLALTVCVCVCVRVVGVPVSPSQCVSLSLCPCLSVCVFLSLAVRVFFLPPCRIRHRDHLPMHPSCSRQSRAHHQRGECVRQDGTVVPRTAGLAQPPA